MLAGSCATGAHESIDHFLLLIGFGKPSRVQKPDKIGLEWFLLDFIWALTWILRLYFPLNVIDKDRAVVLILHHFPAIWQFLWSSSHRGRSYWRRPGINPSRCLPLVVDEVFFASPRVFSRVGVRPSLILTSRRIRPGLWPPPSGEEEETTPMPSLFWIDRQRQTRIERVKLQNLLASLALRYLHQLYA